MRVTFGEDVAVETFALEGAMTRRVYEGLTNRVILPAGSPGRLTFSLRQGAPVNVLVASDDAGPIKLKVLRRRSDGTTELVQPVTAPSGFALARVEPRGEGEIALALPQEARDRTFVVWLECKVSRCAPRLQPGEVCYAGLACDDGLVCADAAGNPAGGAAAREHLGHRPVRDAQALTAGSVTRNVRKRR